jgi:DNA mismatch repair ATPase MutS
MKALLLFKEYDFSLKRNPTFNEEVLANDLQSETLLRAMALDDRFLYDVALNVIMAGITSDPDIIIYRQNILNDCLKNPSIIRTMYALTNEAIEGRRKSYWGFTGRNPSSILYGALEIMKLFLAVLRKLRKIADEQSNKFESEGFKALFAMLKRELDDEYFATANDCLRDLKFPRGVMISAELKKGNKGANYTLCKSGSDKRFWIQRIISEISTGNSFSIDSRDEAGAQALSRINKRGINLAANALAQSVDHIQNFFDMLRTELAFYIGCINLHEKLVQMGASVSFPLPAAPEDRRLAFSGLYDICLALIMSQRIVGNDVKADGKELMIITGANQGGKSTFLRSIGLAQLMMQCGMFVPAEAFNSSVCDRIFTHFKKEEDTAMNSGKLDEELSRMSAIVDNITSNSMVLFNESFAATNEREGSEIAQQIISALLEKHVRVTFVTHLYSFAHGIYDRGIENAIFLRAERQADGRRTYKLVEGEPLQTSYGEDLYNSIFGGEVL